MKNTYFSSFIRWKRTISFAMTSATHPHEHRVRQLNHRQPAAHWLALYLVTCRFPTCPAHFINHQNFGYEAGDCWNNFTYGVHFPLITKCGSQSLPHDPHQKTSQACSLVGRLATSPASHSAPVLHYDPWHNDMMWFAPVTRCCGAAGQQECFKSYILVDIITSKALDFSLNLFQFNLHLLSPLLDTRVHVYTWSPWPKLKVLIILLVCRNC